MPEDVVEFLESIFDKPMDTWSKDPGYATRIVGMCPPPSNSSILVSTTGKCHRINSRAATTENNQKVTLNVL
jgi:hypothetical protein